MERLLGWAGCLVKRMQAGETADVLLLTKQSLDAMVKEGRVVPGSNVNVSSSGRAVVVKQGAPKFGISTQEAYKQTLLKVKTIAHCHPAFGGASGVFFVKSLERVGPDTKEPNAAKALIMYLQSREAATVYMARGLKPEAP